MKSFTPLLIAGSLSVLAGCSAAQANSCAPDGYTIETMLTSKAAQFETLDASQKADMANALVFCLGDPDPEIRDGLAYEGLTAILRSGEVEADHLRTVKANLTMSLQSEDEAGFTAPFAALALAEIARTDRVEAYMTDEEFDALVTEAAQYLQSISDYRGFSDTDGWRHGIAHGADWLMQLSLNPRLTDDQRATILKAVLTQVPAANGHAYIHGEPGRLARPVLFVAMGGEMTAEDWTLSLAPLLDPAPMANWGEAFSSEKELARLHNVKAFLNELFLNASVSSNEQLKPLLPAVTNALRTLP